MNTKTEVFWHKNRKPDLKNSQNRKTENPNVPFVNLALRKVSYAFLSIPCFHF